MEPNQNMPMDPNAVPQEPMAPEGQEMASPEEVNNLKEMMDQIEEKYREMNAEKFAGTNQVESNRKDLVVDVFKALQDAGIDITNVESVKEFLDNLEQSNPDLYQLFVEPFNGLLGQETPSGAPDAMAPTAPTGTENVSPTATSGALPPMPGKVPGGVPSNPGLEGMLPPTESSGIAGRFPNLGK